jgi:hypothetical protein
MPAQYTALSNSTYLDYNSYRGNAPALSGGSPVEHFTINVALVLDRANDPTALLQSDWASRQQQIAALKNSGTLWSTYGANTANYGQVLQDLQSLGISTVDQVDPANGYVSSAESRTIWVQVDDTNFTTLFGPTATLLGGDDQTGSFTWYWTGSLSLPSTWVENLGVRGIMFDTDAFEQVQAQPGGGTGVTLPQGPQSPGNSTSGAPNGEPSFNPNVIGDAYYNFPLTGALWNPSSASAVTTGAIGLIEPRIGTALTTGSSFQTLIDDYRSGIGIATPASVTTVAPGGQVYSSDYGGERSLDVGIVTALNPQSPLIVYAGSGNAAGAKSDPYTSYQAAFFDSVNQPQVITSSWGMNAQQPAPGSPFLFASQSLFADAALQNITVLTANSDGGSGDQFANGVTNVMTAQTSLYDLMVGGTSLSTVNAAASDPTLTTIFDAALAGNPTVLRRLVAGGLTVLPTSASSAATLIETVWNGYVLAGTAFASGDGYLPNNAGTGGVDPTQPVPSYQTAFGLVPTTSDPGALVGRGVPDVSALAGGNMYYTVPTPDMHDTYGGFGTSAATPLWASLISQVDAVFDDQGLPQLGYMNDLLYTAAAIAPASFNDITLGNNISSYTLGGPITDPNGPNGPVSLTPTGYGYSAAPGYDLTTGLGSPNGTVLARTLAAIAQAQSYSNAPAVIGNAGSFSGTSTVAQTLLVQNGFNSQVLVQVGGTAATEMSSNTALGWTSQLAGQSVQGDDFDSALVLMFDGSTKSTPYEIGVAAGDTLGVTANGTALALYQEALTSDYGFVQYGDAGGGITLARPVAIAQTAGGASDQEAIVRIRQNGQDSLQLEIYEVDDLNGMIGTFAPGDPGYQGAAAARDYQTLAGATIIDCPGWGNFEQVEIAGVDAGDILAMKVTDLTTSDIYWGFSQANRSGSVPLFSYGLNTWGWEDRPGTGDHDYNDLVVQIDFTSSAGHGWLA